MLDEDDASLTRISLELPQQSAQRLNSLAKLSLHDDWLKLDNNVFGDGRCYLEQQVVQGVVTLIACFWGSNRLGNKP